MQSNIIKLIKEQQNSKRNLEIQDVYKMIYQGVFGVAHILDNPAKAKQYLEQEFQSIEPSANEKLIENISVSGEVVRLNLRSYKFQNGNVNLIFEAMKRSAKEIKGSQQQFLTVWDEFKQAVFNGELNFEKEELLTFDSKMKSSNYLVMHHSQGYRDTNHPAYRILTKKCAKQLLSDQNTQNGKLCV